MRLYGKTQPNQDDLSRHYHQQDDNARRGTVVDCLRLNDNIE